MLNDYEILMKEALKEARKAYKIGEVPVGAIIVDKNNNIVSRAYNKKEKDNKITSHAEILAILKLAKKIGDWRLNDYTLYVNVEPCTMCASAILQSRISKVVYGCKQPVTGSFGSILNLNEYSDIKVEIIDGVLEEESKILMKDFFKSKRS